MVMVQRSCPYVSHLCEFGESCHMGMRQKTLTYESQRSVAVMENSIVRVNS